MALPNGSGGYQVNSGNLTEAVLSVQTIPTTLTGDTTLTAAQVAVGLVVCKKASDATLTVTLPTAALLDAAVPSAKVGSSFDLTICNDNRFCVCHDISFKNRGRNPYLCYIRNAE